MYTQGTLITSPWPDYYIYTLFQNIPNTYTYKYVYIYIYRVYIYIYMDGFKQSITNQPNKSGCQPTRWFHAPGTGTQHFDRLISQAAMVDRWSMVIIKSFPQILVKNQTVKMASKLTIYALRFCLGYTKQLFS